MGDSSSWNPVGLSRPIMGLLYLTLGKPSYSFNIQPAYVVPIDWSKPARFRREME
jgi:hypothetical protein